jgi:6-phosphofructokinase
MGRIKRIGVLTGGGDCPGLNAVLRGLVKTAGFDHDMQVVGFLDGYAGLLSDRILRLDGETVSGILPLGGTILGSSNRDNPFRVPVTVDGTHSFADRSDEALRTFDRYGLELLVVIGGDGSSAARASRCSASPRRSTMISRPPTSVSASTPP